jgi:cytochrome oxidase assembly protein ShyY1
MRRKLEKENETKRRYDPFVYIVNQQSCRTSLLAQAAIDITPQNKGSFPWTKAADIDQFESDYSFKKVKVRGIFDHNREIQVEKLRNGENGVEIVTPFYTHLNEKGEECGILVNRGWVPVDLKDLKYHYTGVTSGEITGVLYRGDNQTKYSIPNEPTIDRYHYVNPLDISLISQMKNLDEASKFMLMQVDTNNETRQILPTAPNADELTNWKISPERHVAYAELWKYLSFAGIFANTAFWVYF